MKILERERGEKIPGLSQADFIASLILFSSKIPGFDWRDKTQVNYPEYLACTPREKIISEIAAVMRGHSIVVARTLVPQHRLEKLFGGKFQQFTIWSALGALKLAELRQILNQAFPAVARVTFINGQPSVREIWHAHSLVDLGKQPSLPANTVVWAGEKIADGNLKVNLR